MTKNLRGVDDPVRSLAEAFPEMADVLRPFAALLEGEGVDFLKDDYVVAASLPEIGPRIEITLRHIRAAARLLARMGGNRETNDGR